ncbi:unnamed protein product [Euphydryas editha]|uniref:Uncharacterized protein n=1 Tax=Euphydryas editha TaxID=104508 RepID=A0AAU9TKK3_EUPED|nr:unnamed protein product [Euphydryas editha]
MRLPSDMTVTECRRQQLDPVDPPQPPTNDADALLDRVLAGDAGRAGQAAYLGQAEFTALGLPDYICRR